MQRPAVAGLATRGVAPPTELDERWLAARALRIAQPTARGVLGDRALAAAMGCRTGTV